MAARENILKAAETLKEQDLDLPQIMEQRATTLQERGMGDLTHAVVPPKKLISELQRSVETQVSCNTASLMYRYQLIVLLQNVNTKLIISST